MGVIKWTISNSVSCVDVTVQQTGLNVTISHIFGAANRNRSEKYGLVVWLCGESCHRNGKYAVHQCKETADYIHKYGQKKCMEEQGMSIDDFRAEFGKNYL